ncbi:MAG: VOC family protein [Hyphomicrobiaceae bacterium]|nr:VOC family protein [Hyphomicrobiaceae bacterium]
MPFPSGSIIATLPALDLDESLDFYQALGFAVASTYPAQGYAILKAGALELHLWLTDDPDIPENTSIYWRVDDVDAVHAELKQKELAPPKGPQATAWGTREINVIDPAGCLIRIGAPR